MQLYKINFILYLNFISDYIFKLQSILFIPKKIAYFINFLNIISGYVK